MTTSSAPETLTELEHDLTELIEALMSRVPVPGLAVGIRADGVDLLRGYGLTSVENPLPIDANTIFVAGSLTKPVIATAVMSLVGDGRLDLDVPVARYVQGLKLADPEVAARVTLRHLLTHTAGWVGDDFEGTDFGPGDDALARAIGTFGNRQQLFPLGALWSYNNSAFWLAGRVIEVITELTLERALSKLVLEPLGMVNSFFFEGDAITHRVAIGHNVTGRGFETARPWSTPRAAHAAGGLLTTIRDLVTFGGMHLRDGRGERGPVLSEPAVISMQQPQVAGAGREFAGIAWVLRTAADHTVISHGGDWNGQQGLLTIVPERGLVICSLGNSNLARRANDDIATWALQRYLGAADEQPVPVDGDESQLDALVGTYALPGKSITIARRNRRLGITYAVSIGPEASAEVAPEMAAAMTTDGRIVILEGLFEGITGDIGPAGEGGWIRIGGRVHPRQHPED